MAGNKISKDMTIGEVVSKFPQTVGVLMKHGFHCVGCHVAQFETLEQGAMAHGMDGEKTKKLIEEMNKMVDEDAK
jgi:hybrid cluster-associated redox disulfide protein